MYMPIFPSPRLERTGQQMFYFLVLQGMAKQLHTTIYVKKVNQLALQENV
jgi:hypothetical protein